MGEKRFDTLDELLADGLITYFVAKHGGPILQALEEMDAVNRADTMPYEESHYYHLYSTYRHAYGGIHSTAGAGAGSGGVGSGAGAGGGGLSKPSRSPDGGGFSRPPDGGLALRGAGMPQLGSREGTPRRNDQRTRPTGEKAESSRPELERKSALEQDVGRVALESNPAMPNNANMPSMPGNSKVPAMPNIPNVPNITKPQPPAKLSKGHKERAITHKERPMVPLTNPSAPRQKGPDLYPGNGGAVCSAEVQARNRSSNDVPLAPLAAHLLAQVVPPPTGPQLVPPPTGPQVVPIGANQVGPGPRDTSLDTVKLSPFLGAQYSIAAAGEHQMQFPFPPNSAATFSQQAGIEILPNQRNRNTQMAPEGSILQIQPLDRDESPSGEGNALREGAKVPPASGEFTALLSPTLSNLSNPLSPGLTSLSISEVENDADAEEGFVAFTEGTGESAGRCGPQDAQGERVWCAQGERGWPARGEGGWPAQGEGMWPAQGEGGWTAQGEGGWTARVEGGWTAQREHVYSTCGVMAAQAEWMTLPEVPGGQTKAEVADSGVNLHAELGEDVLGTSPTAPATLPTPTACPTSPGGPWTIARMDGGEDRIDAQPTMYSPHASPSTSGRRPLPPIPTHSQTIPGARQQTPPIGSMASNLDRTQSQTVHPGSGGVAGVLAVIEENEPGLSGALSAGQVSSGTGSAGNSLSDLHSSTSISTGSAMSVTSTALDTSVCIIDQNANLKPGKGASPLLAQGRGASPIDGGKGATPPEQGKGASPLQKQLKREGKGASSPLGQGRAPAEESKSTAHNSTPPNSSAIIPNRTHSKHAHAHSTRSAHDANAPSPIHLHTSRTDATASPAMSADIPGVARCAAQGFVPIGTGQGLLSGQGLVPEQGVMASGQGGMTTEQEVGGGQGLLAPVGSTQIAGQPDMQPSNTSMQPGLADSGVGLGIYRQSIDFDKIEKPHVFKVYYFI